MRRRWVLLGGAGAFLFTTVGSFAADLPNVVKAPPPIVVGPSWSGLYAGVHAGLGGDQFSYPLTGLGIAAELGLNSVGFFGGGQIGYNYQIAPSWVVGIEADISGSAIEGELTAALTAPVALSLSAGSTVDWFGTVRGRVGYLVTPDTLVYATGGWAFGRTTSAVSVTGLLALSASVSNSKSGWVAGGGVEYAFNRWLSFKAEYLYLDLGTDPILSIGGVTLSEHTTFHTVRAGLNIKLGSIWGGAGGEFAMAPTASYPARVVHWSGLYVGVHGGFGGDQFSYPLTGLGIAAELGLTSSGFFGGGQIGYNHQFAQSWVAGIEADISGSAITGELTAALTAPVAVAIRAGSTLDWFGTVRARLGYLVQPNALVYATGGWAFGRTTSAVSVTGLLALSASVTNNKSGWAAGGGLEYAYNDRVSFKTEYLYLDLGTDPILSIAGLTLSEHTTVHTIKAGLNIKLGSLLGGL